MNNERFSPNESRRNRLRLALFEVIKKTTQIEQAIYPGGVVDLTTFDEAAIGETSNYHKLINTGLQEVNGIPGLLDTPEGEQISIVLQEWLGTDPDEPKNHLWVVSPSLMPEITMTVSFDANELHKDTLSLLSQTN